MHLAPPLLIGAIDEGLPETGRPPEVNLQTCVSPIREPSTFRVITVLIPGPRATVHIEHQGQWRLRVTVLTRSDRQGQVRHEGLLVSGLDFDRTDVREFCVRQGGPTDIELSQRPSVAIKHQHPRGRRHRVIANQPNSVRFRLALDRPLAFQIGAQKRKVGTDVFIQTTPLVFEEIHAISGDLSGRRMGQCARNVGFRIFTDEPLGSGSDFNFVEGSLVPAPALNPVQYFSIGGHSLRPGGLPVFKRDRVNHLALRAIQTQELKAPIRHRSCSEPDGQFVIDNKARISLLIFEQSFQFSGTDIEQVGIMKRLIAIIDAHHHFVGAGVRRPVDQDSNPLKIGEFPFNPGLWVDCVQQEVLIAALVLGEKDLRATF